MYKTRNGSLLPLYKFLLSVKTVDTHTHILLPLVTVCVSRPDIDKK